MTRRADVLVDQKCVDLARHFINDAIDDGDVRVEAMSVWIQDACEAFLTSLEWPADKPMAGDSSPWPDDEPF